MKILVTVVTGYFVKGTLRESRSTSSEIDWTKGKSLIQTVSDEVSDLRRRVAISPANQPSILSVSHSILPD